ncbi:ATP-binding cassette domain-containing protein [Oceanimonas sp. NS1]|nr:ATP-binding cassette domain-containing protein [Oceanimonas sp. NS1]
MAAPDEQEEGRRFVHHPEFRGDIVFDRVNFRYPGSGQDVLSNVSLHIRPGEKVAVIGRIGSGKTTLERLVAGLYQPTQGAIRIDGIDMHQLQPAVLRSNMGCVPQDVTLFYGTIRDNIVIANPWRTKPPCLAPPSGPGLPCSPIRSGRPGSSGGRGRPPAVGGQRQAVAIARALLNDPVMLVLDEPTSNMDNRSELHVRQQLQRLDAHQTLLLVTHRTSMLEVVNRIIVLEQGRVMANGPREQKRWRSCRRAR